MKKSAQIRIAVWSILAIVFTVVLVLGICSPHFGLVNIIKNGFHYDYDNSQSYSVGSTEISSDEISANHIKRINIDWDSGRVTVMAHDKDSIIVQETEVEKEEYKLQYSIHDNELDIKMFKPRVISIAHYPRKDLTVYVPAQLADSLTDLDINTASADVEVNGISASELDAETASGNVTVKDGKFTGFDVDTASGEIYTDSVTAVKIDLDTVSGNCKISGEFNEIDFRGTSGDFELKTNVAPTKIDIDEVSGTATIYLPEDIEGFRIEKSTVSGKFNCDFPLTANGDENTYSNGGYNYQFESVSGDINVKKA